MIFEEIKNIKSGKEELKKFGLMLGIIAFFWISLFSWHRKSWYPYLFILPGMLIFFAYFCPSVLRLPQKILKSFFILINWIVTRLILSILFYFVITPTSILLKLFGKRFLDLRFDKGADSYWVLKEKGPGDKKSYQKQF
ncbi:MAG: hypothetical protein ABIE75_03445 [Candidatus Omnitrophota bacterium]